LNKEDEQMPLFGPPDVRKLKEKGDIKGLTKALSYQKDEAVRRDAARALGQICDIRETKHGWNWYENGPPPCVEPLMVMCFDENLEVSTAAIWALGRMGDHRALGPLVAIQQDKNESAERRRAAEEAISSGASQTFADLLAIWRTQGAPWLKRR
jgi:HEAT repeat protein